MYQIHHHVWCVAQVLMQTRSASSRTRCLALEVVAHMLDRLREEYLVLLPEVSMCMFVFASVCVRMCVSVCVCKQVCGKAYFARLCTLLPGVSVCVTRTCACLMCMLRSVCICAQCAFPTIVSGMLLNPPHPLKRSLVLHLGGLNILFM